MSRWLDDEYYIQAVRHLLNATAARTGQAVAASFDVYLISEGTTADFVELQEAFPAAHLVLDSPAWFALLMMMRADVLVTSRSGTSHLAGGWVGLQPSLQQLDHRDSVAGKVET